MSIAAKNKTENQVLHNDKRPKVSSTAKRLFALLVDFIFALLLANTLVQIFRKEHWDLLMESSDLFDLLSFYGSIAIVLIFKDVFGRSLGKLLLGMTIRKIDDFSARPPLIVLLKRNFLLMILPVEGVVLLRDGYARRLADKWWATVVIDDQKAMRTILRILLGNIILFGFFLVAILFQRSGIEKTAAYQTAEQAIRSHSSLQLLLEYAPEIKEPEMHLDLRLNSANPSLVRARVGDEETGKLVKVSLSLRENPRGWEVLDVEIKPVSEIEDESRY